MFRTLSERVMRNRRVKRRLSNGVPIYVSPDSQLKYLKRTFDTDLTEMVNRFVDERSAVWDIGANCGVLAFLSAKARQIVAVEADPFLAHLLQESVHLSGVPVNIVPAAAFSGRSLASFSIARRGRASNFLSVVGGNDSSGGERARIMVPTITLDDLLDAFDPPTFVKIDVEGAEVQVFEGAQRLLREVRPVLYYEATEKTAEACAAILREAGYRVTPGAELNWLAEPA